MFLSYLLNLLVIYVFQLIILHQLQMWVWLQYNSWFCLFQVGARPKLASASKNSASRSKNLASATSACRRTIPRPSGPRICAIGSVGSSSRQKIRSLRWPGRCRGLCRSTRRCRHRHRQRRRRRRIIPTSRSVRWTGSCSSPRSIAWNSFSSTPEKITGKNYWVD